MTAHAAHTSTLFYACFGMFALACLLFLCKCVLLWIYRDHDMSMKKEDTNDHKTVEEPAIHSSQIHRVAHSLDIVAYIVLWYGISIGMTMFMKWFYNQWHVTGFPFPITTTACHMAIKLWISRLSRRCCIADAKFSILSRRSYWWYVYNTNERTNERRMTYVVLLKPPT